MASNSLAMAGIGLALLAASAQAQTSTTAQEGLIRERLSVEQWTVQQVTGLPEAPGMPFGLQLTLGGEDFYLEMAPHSVRSRDFEVIVADDDGLNLLEDIPEPATYRGDVRDAAGAFVGYAVGSALHDRAQLIVVTDMLGGFEVFPLVELDPNATPGTHLVYSMDSILPTPGTCGTHPHESAQRILQSGSNGGSGGGFSAQGTTYDLAVAALDIDFQLYQTLGSNVNNVMIDMENLFAVMEVIYERDLNISWEISTFVIRTSNGSNPYTTSSPGGLLNQFENLWSSSMNAVPRDVAHLMTGRNLDGSIIGIAAGSEFCTLDSSFALSQSRFTSNLTSRVGLTAHEIGHNLSAGHCNGASDCYIMCSGLGGCSGNLTLFGSNAMNGIGNFKDQLGCFRDLPPPQTIPFFDDFEADEFVEEKWMYIRRAKIRDGALNEPSGTLSMQLNSVDAGTYQDDDIRSNEIDLSSESDVNVLFFLEQRGAEPGETFEVNYYADNRLWKNLLTVVSDGALRNNFTFYKLAVPNDGYWNEFRLQFRVDGNIADDRWWVDDVHVTQGIAHTITNLQAGQTASFSGYGADPGESVYLVISLGGLGMGLCFQNVCLDIAGIPILLGAPIANGSGEVHFPLTVPAGTQPITIYSQAVVLRGATDSVKSNPVAITTLP